MAGTYIAFSRPKKPSLFTRLAMWLDGKSSFSHTLMIYEDVDWKCSMVIQVDEFGFRLVPLAKYIKKNDIVKYVSTDGIVGFEDALARVAREYVGEMYDFKGFIGMAWVLVMRFFKRRIKNPFYSSENVICSEACALALKYANFPPAANADTETVSPKNLETMLLDVN